MAVKISRARSTGTVIELWRAEDLGVEDEAGDWVTVCEHGSSCHHHTRAVATSWMSEPETWCETGCRHAAYQRQGCATCGGELQWAEDAWICTSCGDEWTCTCVDCQTPSEIERNA